MQVAKQKQQQQEKAVSTLHVYFCRILTREEKLHGPIISSSGSYRLHANAGQKCETNNAPPTLPLPWFHNGAVNTSGQLRQCDSIVLNACTLKASHNVEDIMAAILSELCY